MKILKECLTSICNLLRGLFYCGQFCFVYKGTRIGNNVTVFPGAVIGRPPASSGATKKITNSEYLPSTVIGNNCIIGSNSVIYKGVFIENNTMICDNACIREKVYIGQYSLIAMGVTINSYSKIGSGVKIMDNCHVTSNCIIEDHVFIGMLTTMANDNTMGSNCKNTSEQMGPMIKTFAKIGQGSCLFPEIIIGEYSIVGANSTVTKSVEKNTMVIGSPAKVVEK